MENSGPASFSTQMEHDHSRPMNVLNPPSKWWWQEMTDWEIRVLIAAPILEIVKIVLGWASKGAERSDDETMRLVFLIGQLVIEATLFGALLGKFTFQRTSSSTLNQREYIIIHPSQMENVLNPPPSRWWQEMTGWDIAAVIGVIILEIVKLVLVWARRGAERSGDETDDQFLIEAILFGILISKLTFLR